MPLHDEIEDAQFRRQGAWARVKTKMVRVTEKYRTTPYRLSFESNCDYQAYYCLRAHDTGKLCAVTGYRIYHDFVNYCMLDYVNCMENFEVWQVMHMGACFSVTPLRSYEHWEYSDDKFLDKREYFQGGDPLWQV